MARTLLILGIVAIAAGPETAAGQEFAKVPSAASRGFALVPRAARVFDVNRVACPVSSSGLICSDVANATSLDGAQWPAGTQNAYVWRSGLSLAGLIGADGGAWAGDTSGAMFYDPKGTTVHGEGVELIYASFTTAGVSWSLDETVGADSAAWPDAARVPSAGQEAELFAPHLRGRIAASDGDAWFASWDGNPQINEGRPHPLGVLVETRLMGWRGPQWNQDIVYVVFTIHNVTAREAAAYAAARPEIRPLLAEYGARFQALNEAEFGVELPDGGYTLERLHAGMFEDADIADAGANHSSVALPLATGFSWNASFTAFPWWEVLPAINSPPFFAGTGLTGMASLAAPGGGAALERFSVTLNSSTALRDPQNVGQLFRYFAGELAPDLDQACNQPAPHVDRVCFIPAAPTDTRYFYSAPAVDLGPGESVTFVVAYPFAAPVRVPSYTSGVPVAPGMPWQLGDVSLMVDGVNLIDSIAGYRGFTDRNGDGVAEAGELDLVPGSYYGKVRLAQVMFANGFVSPERPETPEFFLIPGDEQVTVVWRPSPSEQVGDRFFAVAASALLPDGSANPLYDPNYRQFDVEGYRIYRGRTDDPAALELVQQFDYDGTTIGDHAGQVNPSYGCAPELGVVATCAIAYDPVSPGVERTAAIEYPLVGEIVQVRLGERVRTDGDMTILLSADTVGAELQLTDSNVPFAWVDRGLRNSSRYFYAVTAFDVNSAQSGPAMQESPLVPKAVVPRPAGSNVASSFAYGDRAMFGRGEALSLDAPIPAINAATGTFNGPFPPGRAWDLQFVSAVSQVLDEAGTIRARLDSISAGNYWSDEPHVFWFTGINAAGEETGTASAPFIQDFLEQSFSGVSSPFLAAPLGKAAEQFGGSSDFSLTAQVEFQLPGGYFTIGWGRAFAFGPQTPGFEDVEISQYNGPRWFTGATEPAEPVANNAIIPTTLAEWSNAGALPGVNVIHAPRAYLQGYAGVSTREYEGVLGAYVRGADMQVYWGEGGVIDSVIDVTHNVAVEFDPRGQTGYGLLTAASAAGASSVSKDSAEAVVTFADFLCTEPLLRYARGDWSCSGSGAGPYQLVRTATLSTVAFGNVAQGTSDGRIARRAATAPADQQGFGLYMPGHFFLMETDQIPADGTVWTLRSYVGAFGGGGPDPYVFYEAPLPLTATGVEIQVDYEATNVLDEVTANHLRRVHTVPDPFYLRSGYGSAVGDDAIQFVNLPARAVIRIYTVSGVLVTILEHGTTGSTGAAAWNLRNRDGTPVAPGVYFYHVESGDARAIGKFTVITAAP